MSEKIIDIKDSVYQICSSYPEIMNILSDMGFTDITKPGMLNTVGRFMTLDKGASLKKLNLDELIDKLNNHGFQIIRR